MEAKMIFLRNWRFLFTSLMFSITFPASTMADDVATQVSEEEIYDGLGIKEVVTSFMRLAPGDELKLTCIAPKYEIENITWTYDSDDGFVDLHPDLQYSSNKYSRMALLRVESMAEDNSGVFTCLVTYKNRTTKKQSVYVIVEEKEINDGFGIKENVTAYMLVAEYQPLKLTCMGAKNKIENVTWTYEGHGVKLSDIYLCEILQYSTNEDSLVALIRINITTVDAEGTYTCLGTYKNGTTKKQSVFVNVEESREIRIVKPQAEEETVLAYPNDPISLNCVADAVPKPTIQWFKDGVKLSNNSDVEILVPKLSGTIVDSTLYIRHMLEENKGKYECVVVIPNVVSYRLGMPVRRFYNVSIKEESAFTTAYLGIIGIIFFLLLVLLLYHFCRIRKEKQFRKELEAAGLLYWKEGVTGSINPDLMIDEQAELLPYDEKFEFPPEKLKLGKQIGAGAFGVVYRAEARGIVIAEETTTVAVKMVKKTADNMDIKALASELKIMVHLGKHINIVNLLGACTKNIGKRELIVIVEYCKFGCLHSYLQKHRMVFIDQLTDSKENTYGLVNRRFYPTSNNSANDFDYLGDNHTQATDNTSLNTSHTDRSWQKVSETGYVQPEWRSNYTSDYNYDGRSPGPLCSRDLLCWAFQIARGMDYLATRKVLHGDLAARNILLAEDNVVKICDFGLARSIYKNYQYQKKENSPLPVKWLAIECMTDHIFSTQSDIWSFGIVLWELFSLAKTPYPNISLQGLLQWLLAGNRLERPRYADDRTYDVMRRCWDQTPTVRPNFTELQELLGSFLEDNVRNYYIDLNSPYNDLNITKRAEGVEDYLTMVCAPDYNNMISPSPHHFLKQMNSLLPSTPTVQLQHDDEGYLKMIPAKNQTIFISGAQDPKFDFDSRKLNPRTQTPELNDHSEVTPMLTMNNLPAQGGSESDQEGSTSPYLNTCPRIEEESDDVFEKQHNAKNNAHNIAVSNPVYSTYDGQLGKKPHNLAGYVIRRGE